jgi:protease-4
MVRKFFDGIKATLGFIQNHFKALIFLLILFLLFAPSSKAPVNPANLVQIDISGMILSAEETVAQIDAANEDSNIKGIFINVNSPGGMVPPSIEIAHAIKRADKPVIAYASGTMTSGSYYASIYADKIYANPGSLVGSIGVIFEGMNFEKMLETLGVAPQTVKTGTYKEAGTPMRSWSEAERNELQTIADDVYAMFINDVAQARGLDVADHAEFADAHIFNAYRAKEKGLIDEVSTQYDAKKALEALSKVTEPRWKEKDRFEKFMEKFESRFSSFLTTYFNGLKAVY